MDQDGHEENGMIVDFGNVKKYMMDLLDAVFDHGFVVYHKDTAMMNMFFPGKDHSEVFNHYVVTWEEQLHRYEMTLKNNLGGLEPKKDPIALPRTCYSDQDPSGMKIIVVDYVPTAENLAAHMFNMLRRAIRAHYGKEVIDLVELTLYETPNGSVSYTG
jgi:6-pyruvoyltetrahydropterin/6-carboxytetrahydropterin synthase